MEQSPYVDVTLTMTKRLREEFPRVGVCLQAYLFRTREDLEDITSHGIGVRLVKGAYNEPASVAFPKKSDVDANYYALAQVMLGAAARAAGSRPVFGTHDLQLIQSIRAHAQIDGREARRVRNPHALRHPEGGAAAPVAGRRAGARADRLRRLLVPVVHAAARRAAGQRLVRGQEPLWLDSSFDRLRGSIAMQRCGRLGGRHCGAARRSRRSCGPVISTARSTARRSIASPKRSCSDSSPPFLWWLHPGYLRSRIVRALIVALVVAKAGSRSSSATAGACSSIRRSRSSPIPRPHPQPGTCAPTGDRPRRSARRS